MEARCPERLERLVREAHGDGAVPQVRLGEGIPDEGALVGDERGLDPAGPGVGDGGAVHAAGRHHEVDPGGVGELHGAPVALRDLEVAPDEGSIEVGGDQLRAHGQAPLRKARRE
ncbi:hypothetical protein D3C87_1586490 [compost metagenome]